MKLQFVFLPKRSPRTLAFVNAEYGECETVPVPLMPGWEYTVSLEHDSSSLSEPDYDYLLSCAAPSRVVVSDGSGLLGENSNSGESFEAAGKVAKLYVLGVPKLVPDFDRDGDIDDDDEAEADSGRTFRFWINDDQDSGDVNENSSNDVSGWLGDCTDGRVSGRCDLLDFTPVLIDVSKVFPPGTPQSIKSTVTWELQSDVVSAVWTALAPAAAGSFHRTDCGAEFGKTLSQPAHKASVSRLGAGMAFPKAFAQHVKDLIQEYEERKQETWIYPLSALGIVDF